jgi:hypothetical protein
MLVVKVLGQPAFSSRSFQQTGEMREITCKQVRDCLQSFDISDPEIRNGALNIDK